MVNSQDETTEGGQSICIVPHYDPDLRGKRNSRKPRPLTQPGENCRFLHGGSLAVPSRKNAKTPAPSHEAALVDPSSAIRTSTFDTPQRGERQS
jgi:hypothetical protein